MKKNAAFLQLFFLKQLAGIGFPGVLLSVKTNPAAYKKCGEGKVRINAEE